MASADMVKPSSPTPIHLRNLKLFSLDRRMPQTYIPVIFFYKPDHPLEVRESLKKSLSNVLTQFYPLAGRLCIERSSIDCNDLGALFVECKVEGNLMEVIKDPNMDELENYLPPIESSNGDIILAIQISLFDCGGIAVVVRMHHNAGDANSLEIFMNAWPASSRGGAANTSFSPTFDMATLFPPRDDGVFRPPILPLRTEKFVTKRLPFDNKDLENLKLQASGSGVIKDPTRVEAVSSFLLKRFRDASKARGSKKCVAVCHVVNMRPRMDLSLPNHAFGNAIHCTFGLLPVDDDEGDLVEVLRNVLRKIDQDFVKEIQLEGDRFSNSLKDAAKCSQKELWFFSSWTRFLFYQVDYGWGSPKWVIPYAASSSLNHVLFITTSSRDGIEACVNVQEQDAAIIDFSLIIQYLDY